MECGNRNIVYLLTTCIILIILSYFPTGATQGADQALNDNIPGKLIARGLGDAFNGSSSLMANLVDLTSLREESFSPGIPYDIAADSVLRVSLAPDSLSRSSAETNLRLFVRDQQGSTLCFEVKDSSLTRLLSRPVEAKSITAWMSRCLYLEGEAQLEYKDGLIVVPGQIDNLRELSDADFRRATAIADGRW